MFDLGRRAEQGPAAIDVGIQELVGTATRRGGGIGCFYVEAR